MVAPEKGLEMGAKLADGLISTSAVPVMYKLLMDRPPLFCEHYNEVGSVSKWSIGQGINVRVTFDVVYWEVTDDS